MRPYIGFLIYVCFAIIKPDQFWFWSVPEGNYSRTIAIALLLGWTISGFGNWNLGPAKAIIYAMLGYWLVLVFGAFMAPDQELGWLTIEPMAKTFLPILVGISLIDSFDKLKQLMWVIVLTQGYLAYEFNLLYYTTFFLPQEFTHGGLDNNGIAITMDTSIGLAFFLGMHASKWWQRGIAFGSAGLMAHVVLFSNSRGGMLALLVTCGIGFLLVPKQPKHYLVFLLALMVVVRLAGAGVQERFMTSFDSQEEGGKRVDHWKACIDSITKHPLGVGPNHWPITAPQYGLPVMAAHSTWLQTGAELGIPGLLCLASVYGFCIWRLAPFIRDSHSVPDPWMRYAARMVIASLAGFALSAQFVTVDGIELPYYIALIGAASLKLAYCQPLSADDPSISAADLEDEASALEHAAVLDQA